MEIVQLKEPGITEHCVEKFQEMTPRQVLKTSKYEKKIPNLRKQQD
jgi:hypothetical protein